HLSMSEVFILSAARTPIGKFGGGLSTVPATELGATAIRAAVERAGIAPERIDEAIMGQVIQAGAGQAPARQAALKGGLPEGVSATTVNKVCGSGMKAVMLGAASIRAGDAQAIVAGGMENMNLGPYLLPGARAGYRLGNQTVVDSTVHDGLWCATCDVHMGLHAERVAAKHDITRQAQDEFALRSHQRALAAIEDGRFREEIVPVSVEGKKGPITVDTDENPRPDTSLEALARLKPAFQPDKGTVTAGNAPGITDGAAAVVIASEEVVEADGLQPLARIIGYAQADVAPEWLFEAPIYGVRRLIEKVGGTLEDFDLIEINEAFAAQVLADGNELGFDWDRVNVNGGAIALGHPIGASGARVLTTLLYELRRRGGGKGLATLCLGGGGAVAMAIETV
ncbi:MAG TPA: acetyl-CoA C-acetyltransferase, partial [Candidatus Limnocylindria bacterium]|nr:acetyl-CoA C-acetyltransferase [Candidatus Limnocylindria bacterium]